MAARRARKSGRPAAARPAKAKAPAKSSARTSAAKTGAHRSAYKPVRAQKASEKHAVRPKNESRAPKKRGNSSEKEHESAIHGSTWSGTLSFGLVSIPVRLVSAERSHRTPFRLLHEPDLSPLHRGMRRPGDEQFAEPEDIALGYEIEPGHFVTVTRDELDSVAPERTRTIELSAFVDQDEIDPLYYERFYYLVPTASVKAYTLLAEALKEQNRVGIGRVVMHTREYVVAVRSLEGALCLFALRFQDEIRPIDEIPAGGEAEKRQVEKIVEWIRRSSNGADPTKYDDPYQERVNALVKSLEKKKGVVEIQDVEEDEEEGVEPEDLVAALEQSLAKAKGKRK